jgi:hypothetical protein
MRGMHHRTLIASALALAACSGEITGETVVTKPDVRQPSAEGDLVSIVVLPGALELRYDGVAPAFHIGDIVWGTEGPGYLREVTAVEADQATVRLATVDAALDDAFDEIHVEESDGIAPMAPTLPVARDERLTMRGADGVDYAVDVRYAQPTFSPIQSGGAVTFMWSIPELAITVIDPDGAVRLTLAAREVRVDKTITVDAGLDWTAGHLDELHFIVGDDSRYVVGQLAVAIEGTAPLFDQAIPLVENPAIAIVPVGPLVFTLGAKLELGLDALVSGAGELHTTGDGAVVTSTRTGLTWDGSFHPIDERSVFLDADVGTVELGDAHASVDAAVSLQGSVRFALYGVAGPELYAAVTPVDADLTADAQGWQLAVAASATGGLRFVLPFVPVDELQLDFGTWEQTYYETDGTW